MYCFLHIFIRDFILKHLRLINYINNLIYFLGLNKSLEWCFLLMENYFQAEAYNLDKVLDEFEQNEGESLY